MNLLIQEIIAEMSALPEQEQQEVADFFNIKMRTL